MTEAERIRIQRFADKYGVTVYLVGSHADGTVGSESDYDYIIGDSGSTSRLRQKARRELPRGIAGGEIRPTGIDSGIDVFNEPLDKTRPYVIFSPQAKENKP